MKSGSQIELGENVQLRSIVRHDDGWNYSKLTDVVIQRSVMYSLVTTNN